MLNTAEFLFVPADWIDCQLYLKEMSCDVTPERHVALCVSVCACVKFDLWLD